VLPFKQVSISSPLQEIITEVTVEEGDKVKEGQVLVRLNSEKEELDSQQYAKLIERREFEAKGAETLFKEKMASRETALEKQTDLDLAKIQLQIARARLNEKSIKAPISGIIVKKYKESGEAVDRVEKLLDLIDIDKVYVQFYLDPKFLEAVKVDQKINVQFPSIGEGLKTDAIVSFIDPRLDAASGLFRVKLLLENGDHKIKSGMRALGDFVRPSVH
jgi:membrane fusion protein (multidrug efflux system)